MKNKRNIEEEVQQTMKVLDQLERVEGNPYLMTRLREQINKEGTTSPRRRWQLAPVLQIAAVGLLLLINILSFQGVMNQQSAQETTLAETLANEYGWSEYSSSTTFYDSQN